ncbi:MAG: sodium:proton antiporter NhaD [Bacteroidales bacterium]|jgi:Na+/H+ antiporter NhaD/arsenite permease-like protein|nr:sodium:proton antiporter NhaD [Bacteroidales bacterium]
MFIFMIVLFLIGYTCIALEHPIKINKTATALLLGVLLWVCAMLGGSDILVSTTSLTDWITAHPEEGFKDWLVHGQLIHALGEVSEILFFLLGAMTIVELVDSQGGFKIITDKIVTTKKVKLLWIIGILAFFMSAVLDNLTTSIVMVALLRKLIASKKDCWFFASIVIIAANSGGAWSPIGDVTTIMLWIAGKVSVLNIIEMTFLSSLMSLLVPLVVLSFILKGNLERPQLKDQDTSAHPQSAQWQSVLFLCLGVGALVFVPIFKTITHLPPYLGMLGGLSILWIVSEIVYRNQNVDDERRFSISNILTRVDMPSILFFLGILMAVNALQTVGHLSLLSSKLDTIPLGEPNKYYLISMIIGVVSSIVDNVPLVAATMGMYSFPIDHYFWEFIAYCAGTGGSILIIGSAAGVAVMGMEKIDFIWYLKHISWIALLGYFAGCATFVVEKKIRESFGDKHETTQTIPYQDSKITQSTYYM